MTSAETSRRPPSSRPKNLVRTAVVLAALLVGASVVVWVHGRDRDRIAAPSDRVQAATVATAQTPAAATSIAFVAGQDHVRRAAAPADATTRQPAAASAPLTLIDSKGMDAWKRGDWGFALSESEAQWMDRQGMSSPGGRWKPYEDMDFDELMRRARAGDNTAALVGAARSGSVLFGTGIGLDVMRLSRSGAQADSGAASGTAAAAAARQELATLMTTLMQTAEWQRLHEFLWQGVIHGSGVAAGRMFIAYSDRMGRCYRPQLCMAWAMVAWRMGNWDVVPSEVIGPGGGDLDAGIVSGGFHDANRLWGEINAARAEQGLGPLEIDLRPNQAQWAEWNLHPNEARPIIRR